MAALTILDIENHSAVVVDGLSTAITAARLPGLDCRKFWHK
jgi:hypothetical protein